MESSLQILVHRNDNYLQLKLLGDLDGPSAYQLVGTINEHLIIPTETLIIHTSGLKNIEPLGRSVFQTYLPAIKRRLSGVVITGHNKETLARPQALISSELFVKR
jgi:hypothetical protein